MAHYVASVNLFESDKDVSVSMKVFRVFEFGARPSRPVWQRAIRIQKHTEWTPQEWLAAELQELLAPEQE